MITSFCGTAQTWDVVNFETGFPKSFINPLFINKHTERTLVTNGKLATGDVTLDKAGLVP